MIIKARDLKHGDVIGIGGVPAKIYAAYFANGSDGDPVTYASPTPENPKSAVAMKLITGNGIHFIHPAKDVTILKYNGRAATSMKYAQVR